MSQWVFVEQAGFEMSALALAMIFPQEYLSPSKNDRMFIKRSGVEERARSCSLASRAKLMATAHSREEYEVRGGIGGRGNADFQ